jgi:hypothetical protein
MMTINALCLFSITEFMDEMLILKEKYGQTAAVMSFNILRFPSFQSIVTLPENIRLERADHIEKWLEKNWKGGRDGLLDMERDGIIRTIDYIRRIESGHRHTSSKESRERDWKSFYSQYDKRRKKDFLKAFPMLKEWWDSIPETNVAQLKGVIDGDDAKSNRYVDEVLKKAKDEGWVLNPQWANPGAQDYIEPDDQQQDDMIDLVEQLNATSDDKHVGGVVGKKLL